MPSADQQDEYDAQFARKPSEKAKVDAKVHALAVKKQKTGGRKKGSVNKRTLEKIAQAEREITQMRAGKKLAVDHMDDMIDYFRGLIGVLVPWQPDGTPREGRDHALWFRAVDSFQGFLQMRAPYQSPRLSHVALVPQQARHKTVVNVTILNEKGETVFSDTPDGGDDAKLIEQSAGDAA